MPQVFSGLELLAGYFIVMHSTFLIAFTNISNFSGALSLPRWASISSLNTESTQSSSTTTMLGSSTPGNTPGTTPGNTPSAISLGKSAEQSLLTTCVGSVHELTDLLARIAALPTQPIGRPLAWTHQAVQALFYFMRCSQV